MAGEVFVSQSDEKRTGKPSEKPGEQKMAAGNSGLCLACDKAATCLQRESKAPVLYCEMFVGTVQSSAGMAGLDLDREIATAADAGHRDENSVKYTGLCVNCERRADCAKVEANGGVWHCEEYHSE
jgi:hypothetical protein